MDEWLRRWAELEPGALTSPPGGEARAGQGRGLRGLRPESPEGQGVLLYLLWDVIEVRGWRWVMLFAPEGEGSPPYLARVTLQQNEEGQSQRGQTPAHALLAAYVTLLEQQTGNVRSSGR